MTATSRAIASGRYPPQLVYKRKATPNPVFEVGMEVLSSATLFAVRHDLRAAERLALARRDAIAAASLNAALLAVDRRLLRRSR